MRGRARDGHPAPPWRGASSSSSRGSPSHGSSHGWRGGPGPARDAPISRAGLRQASGRVGRQLGEMEMLLSPSRGEGMGLASLTERGTQERFRAHVDDKLAKLEREWPEGGAEAQETRRRAELSTILLDLRKLREGLTASHRVDGFTLKVYADSIKYSVSASNLPQLSACLPHLVFDIFPKLTARLTPPHKPTATRSADPLADSLAGLSLAVKPAAILDSDTAAFYQSLYLLYLICHLADLAAYHSALLAFTSPPPPPTAPKSTPESWDQPDDVTTGDSLERSSLHPLFAYTQRVFAALAATNYAAFARLVPPADIGSVSSPADKLVASLPASDTLSDPMRTPYTPPALHLAVARLAVPRLREQAWPALAKSYKVFTDYEWLARALLFAPGDVTGVKAFIKSKGVQLA